MSEDTNKFDAIVIGAGTSGLLSALALAKEGKRVWCWKKMIISAGIAVLIRSKAIQLILGRMR